MVLPPIGQNHGAEETTFLLKGLSILLRGFKVRRERLEAFELVL